MRRGTAATSFVLLLLMAVVGMPAATAADGGPTVSLAGPSSVPRVGDSFEVSARVTNSGAAAIEDAILHVYVPESATVDSATSSDPTDSCGPGQHPSQFDCRLGTLDVGRTSSLTLTFTRTMARDIWIDAWLEYPAATDDIFAYDGIQIEPDRSNPADVWLQASGPEQPDPGSAFEYSFTVTNKGPETATDVALRVYLSENISYNSATSDAGSCALEEVVYEGEGHDGTDFVEHWVNCSLGSLGFAKQASVTVNVTRDLPGELWSYAVASTASFDENYENDYAELHTPGHPSITSDVAITMDGPRGAQPVGTDLDYALSITNNGPVPAPQTRVGTYVPQGMSLRSLSAPEGIDCAIDEGDSADCVVGTLEVGGHAVVTLSLTRTHARETWVGGWVESPNYDPNHENNWVEIALEPDMRNPADMGVTMSGPIEPAVGTTFDQLVTATNNGPMTANAVEIIVTVPEGADFASAMAAEGDACVLHEFSYKDEGREVAIEPYVYREVRCSIGDIPAGASKSVTVSLTRTGEQELWGSAYVSTASYDHEWGNDSAEWLSTGETRSDDCREQPMSPGDEAQLIACDYESGGGDDRISYETSSKPTRSEITTGGGNDTLEIKVPNGAKRGRRVVVRTARGNDRIVVVAPRGVTNAVVVIRTGAGNDTVDIDAVDPGKGFRVIVISGAGRDSLLGSAGRQKFWGGRGADHLDGGTGPDRLAGGLGRDRCIGGGGSDVTIGC